MFNKLIRIKSLFAFIFVASLISFSGSYQTENSLSMLPLDTITLPANPGPSNNGGSAGWAMFFDLIAGPNNIIVTQMSTGSTAAA
ncbi:MAG: hypothetical protein NTU73_06070, partial [Ignavibacteriae bacterium]|nr:hypothetical protein [Ignavibacteriota bacterium]